MAYCDHDVNHQSITDHCHNDNHNGKDCESDLNVARELESLRRALCGITRYVSKGGISC